MHQPTKSISTSTNTGSGSNKDSNKMEGIIDNTPTLEEFEMDQVLERTKSNFEEWEPKLGDVSDFSLYFVTMTREDWLR